MNCFFANLLKNPHHEIFPEALGGGTAAEQEAKGRRSFVTRGEHLNALEVVPEAVGFSAAGLDPPGQCSDFIHEDCFRSQLAGQPSLKPEAILRGGALDGPKQE
jgi:hypothetical protein